MSRKEARESAFQLIYERITTGEKNVLTFELLRQKNADESGYLESVYFGVCEKLDFLQSAVTRYAKDFAADRIYRVDMSLLLLGAYEILFMSEIPDRVAVNEALELVKVYSTEKSGGFINGILAAVIRNKESLLYEYEHPEENRDQGAREQLTEDEFAGDGNADESKDT